MQRDLRPVLAAGVTAVVSGGLLAAAIANGWLGPDVGRGATFCEAARDGLVRQPANTFSNVGFVAAGLLIAWHAGRRRTPGAAGSVLASHRHLATALACLVVLLGPGSAAMHATQSAAGGHLDMLSMYLVASFAAAYAAMRWWRGGTGRLAVVFFGALVFCELVGLWHATLPVVMYAGNAAFGLLLIGAVALEVLIMRRGGTRARRGFAAAAVGSMLVAFAIWNASRGGLCDPHSLVQGHAAWHLLGALAAYLLYRYYDSECAEASPAGSAGPAPVRAGRPGLPAR
jgi:hypothetical protein